MKEKTFVLIFFSILVCLSIGSFFEEDTVYSQKENRLYAQLPSFSFNKLLDTSFMSESEQYVEDQFLFRSSWLDLKFYSERLLGKSENNGILFGKDKYMMKIETYEDNLDDNITILENFARLYDAQLYLIPTSSYILDAYLPPFAHDEKQKEYFEQLKQYDWIQSMDDVLREHINEAIFYRSDHHLSSLGQFYVYEAWAKKQGVAPIQSEFELVSTSFLGSYARASSNPKAMPDNIYIANKDSYVTSIRYDEKIKATSLYNREYIGKRDEYALFLDGNHGISELTTTTSNGKHLILIKDSYGNAFVPYMLPHYEHITMIDLRFYKKDITELLAMYPESEVMMMYALHNLDEKEIISLSK